MRPFIRALTVVAVLLCAPIAHAEGFDPESLKVGSVVQNIVIWGEFYCFALTNGGKEFLVVTDGGTETLFVYRVARKKGKQRLELLWARDAI